MACSWAASVAPELRASWWHGRKLQQSHNSHIALRNRPLHSWQSQDMNYSLRRKQTRGGKHDTARNPNRHQSGANPCACKSWQHPDSSWKHRHGNIRIHAWKVATDAQPFVIERSQHSCATVQAVTRETGPQPFGNKVMCFRCKQSHAKQVRSHPE